MSASTLLHSNKQLFIDSLREKCMRMLQQNQRGLQQVIVTSIYNHIQYVYVHKTEYISASNQVWLRQQIQNVLKWFGDPRSRWKWQNVKQKQYRWQKERKQWQKTIEKALARQNEIINKYESEILEWKRLYRQGKEKCRQVEAKNAVLESVNKIYQRNLQNNKYLIATENRISMNADETQKHSGVLQWQDKNGLQNESINNQQLNESRSNRVLLNFQSQKSTMTVQMINLEVKERGARESILEIKNQEGMGIMIQGFQETEINQVQTGQVRIVKGFIYPKSSSSQKCSQTYLNKQEVLMCLKQAPLQIDQQIFSISIKIEENEKEVEPNTPNFIVGTSNQKVSCLKCRSRIQQQDSYRLNVSSSESQQSFIVEFDRQIQTIGAETRQFCIQTQGGEAQKKANQTPIQQSIITPLLKKLSHLQKQIDNLTQTNWSRQEKISQIEQMLKSKETQLKEHILQNKQIGQINHLLKSKYEESTKKLEQISQKYRQLLGMFSGYIDQFGNSPYTQVQTGSESEQSEKKTQASIKSISTLNYKQSQQIQHFAQQSEQEMNQEQNTIEKATIARYFFDFLKLELAGGKNQRKLALLTTILTVLGIKEDKENVITRYVDRMGLKSNQLSQILTEVSQEQVATQGKKLEKEGNQWLRERLYQYLTDQF